MPKFLDYATIYVRSGKGGDGMISFRREKYVPNGGPSGGNGGKGGSVILVVDKHLNNLANFRFKRFFNAFSGGNGMNKGMNGRDASNLYVKLPIGTIVRDASTGLLLGDLSSPDQTLVVAKGGRGGRGNIFFSSPRNPAPKIAENGEPEQQFKLNLELKILADVGIVGFPSTGKSTLLSVCSSARPKIAEYHFTTLFPNLGKVKVEKEKNKGFILADLPGLIKGASRGIGLGIQFLRHIERTKIIWHVIDMSGKEGRDPYEDYLSIRNELFLYNSSLIKRPQIIIANKMDILDSNNNLKIFQKKLLKNKFSDLVFPTSGLTKKGISSILSKTIELLKVNKRLCMEKKESLEKTFHYTFIPKKSEFKISKQSDSVWILSGDKLEKLFKMTNFTYDEATIYFLRKLRNMGVDKELRTLGAKNNDTIRVGNFEFKFLD